MKLTLGPAADGPSSRAAVLGGLVWAGVVIGTHYDVGILAWLVGAATGAAVHRIGGSPAIVGNFNTNQMHLFVHHFSDIVRPIYVLWIGLALFAAYRVSGRENVFRSRRRRA